MTKIIYFPLCFLWLTLIAGCQKDTVTPPIIITENDVADMLGSTFASSSSGLVWQLGFAADIADSGEIPSLMKGGLVPIETTMTRQGSLGSFSYQYTARYRYEFSILRDSLDFLYWIRGGYSTPRIAADDSAWANLRFSKFVNHDSCTINGTYNREGIHVLKIREQRQFTSRVTATLVNIVINKVTKKLVYGTINLQVSGESADGTEFSYGGVLSVYGDIVASLILEDETYEIDLDTGNTTWVEDDDDDDDDDGGI